MQPLLAITGILTRANEAKEKTEEAQEKESLELAVTSSQIEDVNTLEITEEKLSDAIKQQFGNDKDFSITDNRDGSFLVSMNDTQRMYYIDETGEIIDQSKMLKISTADELKYFRDDVNSGNTYEGWYVYLANDITLDINEEWEPIGLYLNDSSTPDNENNKPFTGTFDGCGYEIDGIYINTTDKVQGLFGLVTGGKILNLGIGKNCDINGGIATAGIVGYIFNGTTVANCYNNSDITGNKYYIGGIVGISVTNCKVINANNIGNINGLSTIGGIIGRSQITSDIENCYNSGTVTGEYDVGGITGTIENQVNINQCYNTGKVESTGKNTSGSSNVGGIIGFNMANVTNCYNIGTINGAFKNIGGIIGLNRGTLENSFNTGIIEGSIDSKGSIVGNNNEFDQYIGKIYNSYSLEGVVDKLIGSNNSIMGNECSFKTGIELKKLYNVLGKSFKEDTNNINNGYPILQWQ